MPSYLVRKMIVLLLTLPPTFWPARARAPTRWKKWVRQFKFMAQIYINAHTYAFAFTFQLRRSHCLWKHFFSMKLFFLVEKRLRSKTQNNNKTNDNDGEKHNINKVRSLLFCEPSSCFCFRFDREYEREREREKAVWVWSVRHPHQ